MMLLTMLAYAMIIVFMYVVMNKKNDPFYCFGHDSINHDDCCYTDWFS